VLRRRTDFQGSLPCTGTTAEPAAGEPGMPPKPLKAGEPPLKRGMLPMLPLPGKNDPPGRLLLPLPGMLNAGMLLPPEVPGRPPDAGDAPPPRRSKGGKVCGCTTASSFFSAAAVVVVVVLMFLASAVDAARTRASRAATAIVLEADIAIAR
jgi:hypothetical protein